MSEQYYSPIQAQRKYSFSIGSLRKWAKQGKIEFRYNIKGHREFPESELEKHKHRIRNGKNAK